MIGTAMRLIWLPSCETPSPNQQRRKSGFVANGPANRARRRPGLGRSDEEDGGDFEGFCGMVNELSRRRGEPLVRIASRYSHRATIGE
jgi:hypothetical protein